MSKTDTTNQTGLKDPQAKDTQPSSSTKPTGQDTGKGADSEKKSESQTAHLLKRIERSQIVLFHDQREQPYAAIPEPSGRRIVPVRSEEFNKYLSRLAWLQMKWAPGRETIYSVRRVLEQMAGVEGPQHILHVRVATHDGASWVDLDGQSAVRIVPGDWQVIRRPPILFRSYSHQKPLPVPSMHGDALDALQFVNIPGELDRRLFLAWLMTAHVPGIQVPALLVHGASYSGKSSLLTIARRLVDPCIPEFQGKLSSQRDFSQVASQYRMLIFDNESRITDSQSDLLCGAVTGQGDAKRMLYTDEDTVVFEYRNVVCISSIGQIATQPDLLSRSILFELPQVPNEELRRDTRMWDQFEKACPSILGGMFRVLSEAMGMVDGIEPEWKSRMSDFTCWLMAIGRAMEWDEHELLAAYKRNVNRQHESVLESDPVARALTTLMHNIPEWQGTPTELQETLDETARQIGFDTRTRSWPRTARYLSERVSYLEPCLRYAGFAVDRPRSAGKRLIVIRRTSSGATDSPEGCPE